MLCSRRMRMANVSTSPRSTPQTASPSARDAKTGAVAVSRPSSVSAVWRARGTESGDVPMLQECFPPLVTIVAGDSGDQPTLEASRSTRPRCSKYAVSGSGSEAVSAPSPVDANGVPCLRWNSSFKRLRTTLQSPRFSVIAQNNSRRFWLSSRMPFRAATRNSSTCGRTSSGRTTRNCSPPLDPNSILESPSSAMSARGKTSLSRLTQRRRPVRRDSAGCPDGRNSSTPNNLPCNRICTDMRRGESSNVPRDCGVRPWTAAQHAGGDDHCHGGRPNPCHLTQQNRDTSTRRECAQVQRRDQNRTDQKEITCRIKRREECDAQAAVRKCIQDSVRCGRRKKAQENSQIATQRFVS